MRDLIKEQIVKLFEAKDWPEKIENFYSASRVDMLWVIIDFVREGKYLSEAMLVAEKFINDPDPQIEDASNQNVLKGEEVRYIVTVRGTVAWLVSAIINRLDTNYYPSAIDLVEKLCNDKAVYVRQQATYPLASLMINIRAERNKDGSPFNFLKEDKARVMNIAFSMLEDNRDYLRVMEVLALVFEKMRFLEERDAMLVLRSFLYTKKGEFNPDYVTDNIAPVMVFFAEFVTEHNSQFNTQPFKDLLKEVIRTAPSRLKTTIVWHFWKTIEGDPKTYPKFKAYIPVFFEGEFEEESLSQYEFLIEKILLQSPTDAVEFFKLEIDYINRALPKKPYREDWSLWFHNPENIIDTVAEIDPKSLPEILEVLKEISLRRGYIGDVHKIYSSYKKAPEALQGELLKKIAPIYEALRQTGTNLPTL